MSFKTLLMHTARDEQLDGRMRMAAGVADLFGARVIALGAAAPWPYVDATDYSGPAAQELIDRTREDVELTRAAVQRSAGLFPAGFEWRSDVELPSVAVSRAAYAADLILAQRVSMAQDLSFYADPGAVVMEAGTPVLLLPEHDKPLKADKLVFGWKNSRESRRALTMSLPAMLKAQSVVVASVCRKQEAAEVQAQLEAVHARLERHGVKAETRFVLADHDAADHLIELADAEGADLIASGGYGHSRLREWVLGGMTRDLIADKSRYVLLCH
jgi:nucleotide-binding universal stress UspA family protein